jgi:hypothetical protein
MGSMYSHTPSNRLTVRWLNTVDLLSFPCSPSTVSPTPAAAAGAGAAAVEAIVAERLSGSKKAISVVVRVFLWKMPRERSC